MTPLGSKRTLPGDWYAGAVPENVLIDETAYVETSFSFRFVRSRAPAAVRFGRGSAAYLGTMFDLGERGQVSIGDYALVHGARVICDERVTIGDYALISWNVVLLDSYRRPASGSERRRSLERAALTPERSLDAATRARPIQIGANVWIGFDACVLPGVSIGEGSVVAARSVVSRDVEAYTLVAGNPARVVRRLERER